MGGRVRPHSSFVVWDRSKKDQERPVGAFASLAEALAYVDLAGSGLAVRAPSGNWFGPGAPKMGRRSSTLPMGVPIIETSRKRFVAEHVGLLFTEARDDG